MSLLCCTRPTADANSADDAETSSSATTTQATSSQAAGQQPSDPIQSSPSPSPGTTTTVVLPSSTSSASGSSAAQVPSPSEQSVAHATGRNTPSSSARQPLLEAPNEPGLEQVTGTLEEFGPPAQKLVQSIAGAWDVVSKLSGVLTKVGEKLPWIGPVFGFLGEVRRRVYLLFH